MELPKDVRAFILRTLDRQPNEEAMRRHFSTVYARLQSWHDEGVEMFTRFEHVCRRDEPCCQHHRAEAICDMAERQGRDADFMLLIMRLGTPKMDVAPYSILAQARRRRTRGASPTRSTRWRSA